MKIQLVFKVEKGWISFFDRKYYSVKRGNNYKDMKDLIFNRDKYWWTQDSKYFNCCWTRDYKKAKLVFDLLSTEAKEIEYYVLEESECK